MKNAVMIFVSTFLGVISMAIIMTIMGHVSRATELQSNLSYCGEKSLERAMLGNGIIADEQELIAEQMQLLAESFDTDSDTEVRIMKADMVRGILSVSIQERFGQPNGSVGKTEWDRIVIWDREKENEIGE